MQQLNRIKFVIFSTVLVMLLGGCASPPKPQRTTAVRQLPAYPPPELQAKQEPPPASEQIEKEPPRELEQGKVPPPASEQQEREESPGEIQEEELSLPESPQVSTVSPDEIFPETPVIPGEAMEPEKQKEVLVDYADMEFVQQRIHEYQFKYDQWIELLQAEQPEEDISQDVSLRQVECFRTIERILAGYRLLLEDLQKSETFPAAVPITDSPRKMQQLDIAFLESSCGELLAMSSAPVKQEIPIEEKPTFSFDAAQKFIKTDVEMGNYQDALQSYANLAKDFPGQKPSLATELNYGRALKYTGQLEAAADHFSKLMASEDLSVNPISLQLEIADLYLASGNIAAAESYYENLLQAHKSVEAEKSWAVDQLALLRSTDPESQDMAAYMQLLKEFQQNDYRIHAAELNEKANRFAAEHAGRQIGTSGLRLKSFSLAQLHAWFGRQLLRIDSLITDKKFAEASDILKNMTGYYLPPELQAVVQKTYYDITQAELQETETQRRNKEVELTGHWESAVHLLDSQQFDAAILAFEAFAGTEYEGEAQAKIIEAANLAAGQMRKDAASLFIRAGKSGDLDKKKELLLASYNLLNDILIKYPQSDLRDKVNQNITILEEQIGKLDPSLLEELKKDNSSDETSGQTHGPITRQLR